MDGLTTALGPSPAAAGGAGSAAAVPTRMSHVTSALVMTVLMVPALWAGHASLVGVAVTFAFFAWAAGVAGASRRRGTAVPRGAVGDPFAMGLVMAVPYLALGFAGHAHGSGTASPSSLTAVVLAVPIVVGWIALRVPRAGARGGERFGFWWCLTMMVGMLVVMSMHG